MRKKKKPITGNNVSNSPLFPFHFLSFLFIYTPEKYNFHQKICETFFVYCDVKRVVFNALIASSKTPSFSFHLFFMYPHNSIHKFLRQDHLLIQKG